MRDVWRGVMCGALTYSGSAGLSRSSSLRASARGQPRGPERLCRRKHGDNPRHFPGRPDVPPFPWKKRARLFPCTPPRRRGPAPQAALPAHPSERRFPASPTSSRHAGHLTLRRPHHDADQVRSRRKKPPRGNRAPGKGHPPRPALRGFRRKRPDRNLPRFPSNAALPKHPEPAAPP